MLFQIIHKEVLLHLKDARFVWVAGLFCGLVLVGFFLVGRDYTERHKAYQANVMAERKQLLAVDPGASERDQVYTLMNERGVYAFLLPRPLGPFASGLEPVAPTQVHALDRWSWSRQASEAFYRNPLLSLFPRPDFIYIVGSILSLVALFFTFDAICGEKSSGTLKLMLSSGISRDQLLIGKWVGTMLTLVVPFLLSTALGVGILMLMGCTPLDPTGLLRIAGILCFAVVYLSLFVTSGLAISVLVRRPSSALLICLAFWVGVTFVFPHLLAGLGRILSPTPTFQQVRMQKRAVDSELNRANQRLAKQASNFGWSDEDRNRRQEVLKKEAEARKEEIQQTYTRRLDRQIRLSQAFSRISPVACLTYAAAELAGTGRGFYSRVYQAFAQFEEDFGKYARRMKQEAEAGRLKADWLSPEEIPALTVEDPGQDMGFGSVATELLVLILFQAGAFSVAYVRFLFYDVR